MILFLDINGVLSPTTGRHSGPDVSPSCAKVLQHIVDTQFTRIVITSSWRFYYTAAEFGKIFAEAGINTPVIGLTPNLPYSSTVGSTPTRGHEIQAWLNDHPETSGSPILILEDGLDLTPLRAWAYYTNPQTGLVPDDLPPIKKLIDQQLPDEADL